MYTVNYRYRLWPNLAIATIKTWSYSTEMFEIDKIKNSYET